MPDTKKNVLTADKAKRFAKLYEERVNRYFKLIEKYDLKERKYFLYIAYLVERRDYYRRISSFMDNH